MRVTAIGLLVLVLLAGCGGDDIPTLTADDAGTTVDLAVGGVIDVALEANPTTGFTWVVAADSTECLRLVGEPAFIPMSDLLGAGGVLSLEFEVIEAGSGNLVLTYERPWEDVAPLDEFVVHVDVDG